MICIKVSYLFHHLKVYFSDFVITFRNTVHSKKKLLQNNFIKL